MFEGASIIQGRKNNKVILDETGGIMVNSAQSKILVNFEQKTSLQSQTPATVTSNFVVAKPTGSTNNITGSKDIIPLYYPTESKISLPTGSLIDISSIFLPEEEDLTLVSLYNSGSIYVASSINQNIDEEPIGESRSQKGEDRQYSSATSRLSKNETIEIIEEIFKKVLKVSTLTEGQKIFAKAWRQAEGGNAAFNAFNTTQLKPGTTIYNSIGVKNYKSKEDGINANAETLSSLGAYVGIINGLKKVKTIDDAITLARKESSCCIRSTGFKDGGFYTWSEGYYETRISECVEYDKYKKGQSYTLSQRRIKAIQQFNGCPPPKSIVGKYIDAVLTSWKRSGENFNAVIWK